MITISGGQGNFKPHSSDEPVVAICVGCGKSEAPTTTRPTTTTTTRATTKPGPGPTTSRTTTAKTTTEAQTTPPGTCCDTLVLSSTGGIAENYPELLGKYTQIGEDNDRPIFKHQTILTTMHLHYTMDNHFKWEGWMITATNNQTFGYISNKGDNFCPIGLNSGWEFQLITGWVEDNTLSVTCDGSGPNPTDGPNPTGPTPTDGPGPTNEPGPGGIAPTIVAIKRVTVPGSDVFIVGGMAPDQPVDIT